MIQGYKFIAIVLDLKVFYSLFHVLIFLHLELILIFSNLILAINLHFHFAIFFLEVIM